MSLAALVMFAPLTPVEAQTINYCNAYSNLQKYKFISTSGDADSGSVTVRSPEARKTSSPTVVIKVWMSGNTRIYANRAITWTQDAGNGWPQCDGRYWTGTFTLPDNWKFFTTTLTATPHQGVPRQKIHATVKNAAFVAPAPTTPRTSPVPDPVTVDPIAEYSRPEPAENPTNPDGTTNLYGPGGILTPERQVQWRCWAAFGNTEALREAGLLSESESC